MTETLRLDLNGIEPVPAYFVRPANVSCHEPLPTVIYSHAHGGDYSIGKSELLNGRECLQRPPYAKALCDAGYAVICADMWNFGERHRVPESQLFKRMLWRGQILWGMMVFDTSRIVDYVCARPDVDPSRIAAMGMSMGSTMSWWLAALDERIKVCVDICCLTDLHEFDARNAHDLHGLYYYVPDLLNVASTAGINELIAPRAHLSLVGAEDPLTPMDGVDAIDRHLRTAYEASGCPDAWKLVRERTGHRETPMMRREVMSWLERWLR